MALPARAEVLADVLGLWHCAQAEAGQGGDRCIGALMNFAANGSYEMKAPQGCAWTQIPAKGVFKATELDDSVALVLSTNDASAGGELAARVAVRVAADGSAEFSFSSFGAVELAIPQRVTCTHMAIP